MTKYERRSSFHGNSALQESSIYIFEKVFASTEKIFILARSLVLAYSSIKF